eukprot:403371866
MLVIATIGILLSQQLYLVNANNLKYNRCRNIEFCGRYRVLMRYLMPGQFENEFVISQEEQQRIDENNILFSNQATITSSTSINAHDSNTTDTKEDEALENQKPLIRYNIDKTSILFKGNFLNLTLNIQCGENKNPKSLFLAPNLQVSLQMYDNGVLRVMMSDFYPNTNQNGYSQRFGISDIDGVGIDESHLKLIENIQDLVTIDRKTDNIILKVLSKDKLDEYEYEIQLSPFRIFQRINGIETMLINERDTLYFENSQFFRRLDNKKYTELQDECLNEIFSSMPQMDQINYFKLDKYSEIPQSVIGMPSQQEEFDFRESYSFGVTIPTEHIFGLPERVDTFLLRNTNGNGEPYRLQALDMFPHNTFARESTYSSIPYLHGHDAKFDSNVILMTASEAFVDIHTLQMTNQSASDNDNGRHIQFLGETGRVDILLFGSAAYHKGQNSAKRVQKIYADITGYQVLPPLFSLGFHYSKWESQTSAKRLMEWNKKFSQARIPVDVFWMDIPAMNKTQYFQLDPYKFQPYEVKQMKKEIHQEKERYFVVITDPHIKQSLDYDVFLMGKFRLQNQGSLQSQDDEFIQDPITGQYYRNDQNSIRQNGFLQEENPAVEEPKQFYYDQEKFVNIFVRSRNLTTFYGWCWPGQSAWFDYFNDIARDLWASFYSFEFFEHTDDSFHIWLDMNEPSVFNGPETTMPKDTKHFLSDGTMLLSKDVKNSYGLMMMKSTYQGMILRNQTEVKRPFILTRSAFFGTQKYGAKWTGDNFATWPEMIASVTQILSLSLSGVHFVGADVPGFYETGSIDEIYCQFYQLGTFYPFFRAHSAIDVKMREPYYQTTKVQKIVREAINLRYDLIQYLYSNFFVSNVKGYQIIRPMWFEFPEDPNTFNLQTQFMFGQNLLISPKLYKANLSSSENNTIPSFFELGKGSIYYQVETYFPEKKIWYYWYDKSGYIQGEGKNVSVLVRDDEQGVFVKGGSIIPIKLHQDAESITQAKDMNINLEIYLDENNMASGSVYLDDGLTFKNQKQNERLFLNLILNEKGELYSQNMIVNSKYDDCKIKIKNIIVFQPKNISNRTNIELYQNASQNASYYVVEGKDKIVFDEVYNKDMNPRTKTHYDKVMMMKRDQIQAMRNQEIQNSNTEPQNESSNHVFNNQNKNVLLQNEPKQREQARKESQIVQSKEISNQTHIDKVQLKNKDQLNQNDLDQELGQESQSHDVPRENTWVSFEPSTNDNKGIPSPPSPTPRPSKRGQTQKYNNTVAKGPDRLLYQEISYISQNQTSTNYTFFFELQELISVENSSFIANSLRNLGSNQMPNSSTTNKRQRQQENRQKQQKVQVAPAPAPAPTSPPFPKLDYELEMLYQTGKYNESMFSFIQDYYNSQEFLQLPLKDRQSQLRKDQNSYYREIYQDNSQIQQNIIMTEDEITEIENREHDILQQYKSFNNTVILENVNLEIKNLFSNVQQLLIQIKL